MLLTYAAVPNYHCTASGPVRGPCGTVPLAGVEPPLNIEKSILRVERGKRGGCCSRCADVVAVRTSPRGCTPVPPCHIFWRNAQKTSFIQKVTIRENPPKARSSQERKSNHPSKMGERATGGLAAIEEDPPRETPFITVAELVDHRPKGVHVRPTDDMQPKNLTRVCAYIR